jgi:hypothetical protein
LVFGRSVAELERIALRAYHHRFSILFPEVQMRLSRPISLCLLSIVFLLFVFSASRTTAQNEPGLCMPRTGYELVNYGREWNVWPNGSRSVYLEGFVDGQSHTYLLLQNDLPAERREPLRLRTYTFYDSTVLRDVMTSLYSDPANTYVAYDSMVYIARDKLGGKDIETSLRDARRNGCGYVETK